MSGDLYPAKIEDDSTIMYATSTGQARRLVTTLVKKGKAFQAVPAEDDGCWWVRVSEENERGGMAGVWS